MDLRELNPTIGLTHWYYQTKFLALQHLVRDAGGWPSSQATPHVLVDVGAGSGIFTKAFLRTLPASSKEAYAVDPAYPDPFLKVEEGVRFVRAFPGTPAPTGLLLLDVLEHVDNDLDFLKAWVALGARGSLFVLTVPAFRFLWSDHDVFLGHKRRYTLPEIERLARDAGLVVLKSRYLFAAIVPVAVLLRKVVGPATRWMGIRRSQGIQPAHPLVNMLLTHLFRIEVALGSANRLCGLSCLVVAKKP